MKFRRALFVIMMGIAAMGLTGCSDDNEPTAPGPPDDTGIKTVVVAPDSVSLAAIGEDVLFEATAFDGAGAVVDTVFQWQSSRTDVVVIGLDGVATATGVGTAEIYASAGGVTDTASVAVAIAGGPVIEWLAAGNGQWQDSANWSGGTVPGADDVAVINVPGTYTVSMTADVSVLGLILGGDAGTQTLATAGNRLAFASGGLQGGAELEVGGIVQVAEDLVWNGGTIVGTGSLEIGGGATLSILGEALNLNLDLDVAGEVVVWEGANLRVRSGMMINSGGLLELQGEATVSVFEPGVLSSEGVIRKVAGTGEAAIYASSAEFNSTGALEVDAGSLAISGGVLSGFVDIAAGSVLRQSGTTGIPFAFFNGDGALEIRGSAVFGTYEGQSIKIEHLIVDSGVDLAISGLASLRVDQTFVWRRGIIGDLHSFTTQFGSVATFETSGTKILSNTAWDILGRVDGDSAVNLGLANGAGIVVERQALWNQVSGGTLKRGLGSSTGLQVLGEFRKTGDGAFVVEPQLDCSGTLNLIGGALTVQGDFTLQESGVITGGGTAAAGDNVRLIVVGAPSATMLGTIRPDLDGAPARLAINGAVELGSTFVVELDVLHFAGISTESLSFLTGQQVLNGTLALTVWQSPDGGSEYRVVSLIDGSGGFEAITGGEPFTDIIEDSRGVLLTR